MTTATFTPPAWADMFAKPEEVGKPELLFIMGQPGRWKTSIGAGIVKVKTGKFDFTKARVLLIDVDGSSPVLANDPAVKAKIDDGTFNILPIKKTDPDAFGKLKFFLGFEGEDGTWTQGDVFKYGYDVIILDSLDVAQDIGVSWLTNNTFTDDPANPKKNTQRAWGIVKPWTLGIGWALKDSSALGILIAHSEEDIAKDGTFSIKPALAGKAKDSFASIPDLVAYVDFEQHPDDKDAIQLVATIGEAVAIQTKNRWMLPPKIANFDMPTLFSMIDQRHAFTNSMIDAASAA